MLRRPGAGVLLAVLLAVGIQAARASSLSSIAPAAVTAGQTIGITGTGFDPSAANNTITFTPAAGTPAMADAIAIADVDAAGTRRLTVTVPGGLPVGTTAV